jgi:hypothetical protein
VFFLVAMDRDRITNQRSGYCFNVYLYAVLKKQACARGLARSILKTRLKAVLQTIQTRTAVRQGKVTQDMFESGELPAELVAWTL